MTDFAEVIEANNYSATQEILRPLWNPKFIAYVHESLIAIFSMCVRVYMCV
jgi:hypothetical protein